MAQAEAIGRAERAQPGIGIFEFALTRSRSYSYRPTLAG